MPVRTIAIVGVAAAAACAGAPGPRATTGGDEPAGGGTTAAAPRTPADPDAVYGPLEVGADYATYRRVTPDPFLSLVHGNRWVHVWVNEVGAAAYLDGSPVPVGTIVVKSSVQDVGGKPSEIEGPLYIMEKRAPGFAPDHEDWWFAIHWASPPADEAARYGGPLYWRGNSPRVAYCYECHDGYDRGLGGLVPSSLLPR
jgi:hypothetical protein